MPFLQGCAILSNELNRKQQVPFALLPGRAGGSKGKWVDNPTRSRHCDKGACRRGVFAPVTGMEIPGRRRQALSFESGNLPAAGTGASRPRSRGIGCTKKPESERSFCFATRRQKGLFPLALFPVPFCSASIQNTGKDKKNEKTQHPEDRSRPDCPRTLRRCDDQLWCIQQHGCKFHQHRKFCGCQRSER